MKVIIEEGDVGGLAPGVYDVKVTSTGSETNFWPDVPLVTSSKLCLGIDIDLKQKPVESAQDLLRRFNNTSTTRAIQAGVALWAEIEAGAAMFTNSAQPKTTELVVGTRLKWYMGKEIYTVTGIDPSSNRDHDLLQLTWPGMGNGVTYARQTLMSLISKGDVSIVGVDVKCDKSWGDCRKHRNTGRFGGLTANTTKPACPHTFGSKTCGVGWPMTKEQEALFSGAPPALPDDYVERMGGQMEGRQHRDCEECYGTGLYKGFGGPCSQGCPVK